jgi:hypothetical protein
MEDAYHFHEIGFRSVSLSGAAALILLPHLYFLANRVLGA